MKTKNIKVNWLDEIIEGIRIAAKIRGNSECPAIRICYLMNKFNSSEREINRIIEIMQDIKVDSLRFSIPYDLYGKGFDRVRNYKQTVEIKQNKTYTDMLKDPSLPLVIERMQNYLNEEAKLREKFYNDIDETQKAEFINGEIILHSPATYVHNLVMKHLIG